MEKHIHLGQGNSIYKRIFVHLFKKYLANFYMVAVDISDIKYKNTVPFYEASMPPNLKLSPRENGQVHIRLRGDISKLKRAFILIEVSEIDGRLLYNFCLWRCLKLKDTHKSQLDQMVVYYAIVGEKKFLLERKHLCIHLKMILGTMFSSLWI